LENRTAYYTLSASAARYKSTYSPYDASYASRNASGYSCASRSAERLEILSSTDTNQNGIGLVVSKTQWSKRYYHGERRMTDTGISDELKRVSRRLDQQQKTLDLLFHDRDIFEDMQIRLTAIENAMHLQRATATENAKNTKADIKEVVSMVEAKVDEVNESIDKQTVVVKSPKESVIERIINKVTGK
jgi:hypothetical protein